MYGGTSSWVAATAAALAIDNKTAFQDIEYEVLRERLIKDGQVLMGL